MILAWLANCVTAVSTATADQGVKFAITNTEFYVPVVTLSTQDNAKLPQKLKYGFKKRINWNKIQRKETIKA